MKDIAAYQDEVIQQTPMPEEYKDTKMTVLCNDCLKESIVPFHIAGAKCKKCGSYNTTRTKVHEVDGENEHSAGSSRNVGAGPAEVSDSRQGPRDAIAEISAEAIVAF